MTEPDEQLVADLKALHRDLGLLRRRTARMLATATGADTAQQFLTECSSMLDLIPTAPGVAPIDAWRYCDDGDPDAPDSRTFRRSIASHAAWVVEGEQVLADVLVTGTQTARLGRDGSGWGVERIVLDDWSVQVTAESGLSAARAGELADAITAAAKFCAQLEPEAFADELAARRARR
jgi:hypothetical protein